MILTDARGRGSALTVATTSALRANIQLRRECSSRRRPTPRRRSFSHPTCSARSSSRSSRSRRRCSGESSARSLPNRCADSSTASDHRRHRLHHRHPAAARLRCAPRRRGQPRRRARRAAGLRAAAGAIRRREPGDTPWRSAAALSLADLGRHEEARSLAADEVARAKSFGARPAMGIALRAQAIVGPAAERGDTLSEALTVLAPSAARLEHARVLSTSAPRCGQAGSDAPPVSISSRDSSSPRGAAAWPGAPGQGRAGRDRRQAAADRPVGRRLVDAERAARGRARRHRRDQPRDRPDAVRHREDRGDPPGPRLSQARLSSRRQLPDVLASPS